jgi:hypothetical protein
MKVNVSYDYRGCVAGDSVRALLLAGEVVYQELFADVRTLCDGQVGFLLHNLLFVMSYI